MNEAGTYDIHQKLFTLMMRSKRHLSRAVEKYQMTPVQGMMLILFEPGKGRSMQSLSCMMGCDASNVTGLIERLDSQGLIERTVDPQDRRVKFIKLSKQGTDCRAKLLSDLKSAEALDLQKLSQDEQKILVKIIDKLTVWS